ncbi:TPA: hypothetical protein HA265_00280 [Candidatus Woesearchaeota archaeon]|nr:hypothetical protein [Candidatus Woesearchaeota archaeon]
MTKQKKKELDEEDTYRPLEAHEHQALSDKRIEKIDSRLNRIESLLEKMVITIKRKFGKEECDKGKTQEECDEETKISDDRFDVLEKHQAKMTKDINDMTIQEETIGRKLKYRKKQDAWFALIMLDCRFKISEGNRLNCTKTGKRCNYKNCPIKDTVDEIMK